MTYLPLAKKKLLCRFNLCKYTIKERTVFEYKFGIYILTLSKDII